MEAQISICWMSRFHSVHSDNSKSKHLDSTSPFNFLPHFRRPATYPDPALNVPSTRKAELFTPSQTSPSDILTSWAMQSTQSALELRFSHSFSPPVQNSNHPLKLTKLSLIHACIQSTTYSLSKHLLSTFYEAGTAVDTGKQGKHILSVTHQSNDHTNI